MFDIQPNSYINGYSDHSMFKKLKIKIPITNKLFKNFNVMFLILILLIIIFVILSLIKYKLDKKNLNKIFLKNKIKD
jgi:hypothetical protein